LETAIQNAVSGDTIYLPGALIEVQNDLIISKKLALIGAGWDMDSIGGLKRTELRKNGNLVNINYREGSNGSLLTGCIVGNIVFGYKDDVNDYFDNIENVTIWRNDIKQISLGVNNTTANKVKKISIRENILNSNDYTVGYICIHGNYATECLISNNLFLGYYTIEFLINSYIYNNVINCLSTTLSYVSGCYIQNNYFSYFYPSSCENNSFYNNAFANDFTFPYGTNSGANNLTNQEAIKTFQVNDLNWPKNLQIRDASPCKNAGADGTDIGIYGGTAPYKPGAVPFNPHIDRSSISVQTDKDGNLKVNIQVSAQTK
jgi:hypothetical protein